MALMFSVLLAVAAWMQAGWPERNAAGDTRAALLTRWLTTSLLSATPILLSVAALLGAGCVPTNSEAGEVQDALLTQLRPFEIVLGRLLAALRPVLLLLALSCGFWGLAARTPWGAGEIGGGAVLVAHLALLCAVLMIGSVAALFATGRRPGRAWGRGAGVALALTVLSMTAILLIDPQVRRMDDPVRLIEGALLINPVAAVATPLKLDLLRTQWLYGHTTAPEFEFAYPPPLASATLFAAIAGAALVMTAWRLRAAYRR
jgi:hypothetical protein